MFTICGRRAFTVDGVALLLMRQGGDAPSCTLCRIVKSLDQTTEDPMTKARALMEVSDEVGRATAKFGKFASAHEGYAILKQEVDELWDEIKRREPSAPRLRKEAIQVAAMGIRFLMDVCGEPYDGIEDTEAKR